MSSNWRPVLNKYLANFEVQTTTALENINELLTQSGQKFDDKIKGYFAKSVNSRLEQTLDFFDIQISSQADKNAKCTIKIESKCKVEESIEQVDSDVSSEGVEIIEKEIKFETISSDDDEKVENVSSSYSPISEVEIETTLQMTYERNVYRSSLDSSVSDRRSMCSPSTSNLPMMAPTLSPIDTPDSTPSSTPDINAEDIKQEPQEVPCKAMIFEKAQKDLGGIEVEKVRSNSTTVMKTNRSKLPSTNRSSTGPQVEHSMPVEPQLLKRQPTMSVENELTKRQKTTEVLQMNEPCPSIVFACFYCHNQPCFYVKKFAEVYSHWKNSHAELPLRFVAVRMAACFYCDQVDVFSNLQGHHKHNHNAEVFVVVDRENKSKCGLCQKILSASEMVVHFKTQHRPSHYMHISSPVCFTQSEIDQLLSINSSKLIDAPGQIEAFICGHCQVTKNISEISFMQHIEQDEFQFMCTACSFSGNSVRETAQHELSAHKLPIDTSKQLNGLRKRLERHFLRTRIIFNNGLVLYKHNMLNSIFDDRNAFWPFREQLAKKKLMETPTDELRSKELKKQQAKYNNLRIGGLERAKDAELQEIFQHLCRAIGVMDVSMENDVKQIYRRSMAVIVKLVDCELKRKILDAWRNIPERVKLFNLKSLNSIQSEIMPDKISMKSELTPFFVSLWELAEKARNNHQIHSFWITVDGLRVKYNSRTTIVWSEVDLMNFIESIK